MKEKILKQKNFFLSLVLFSLSLAWPAKASILYFDSSQNLVKENSFLEISVLIDSQDKDINAIEGDIKFPADLLDFVDFKNSNSVVNFWIEEPYLKNSPNIRFAGIVPGGYNGQGIIFKLIFKTKKQGQGNMLFNNAKVLLNDGLGTEDSLDIRQISLTVDTQAPENQEVIIVDISDQEAPDPFTPFITKISEIAGDKYILIFATQDKGSGIDYYMVKEGYRSFVEAKSPYVLKNQDLDDKIFIKAVDKSGNERVVTIAPVYYKPWYEKYSFFGIIILLVIIVLLYSTNVKNKKTKNK